VPITLPRRSADKPGGRPRRTTRAVTAAVALAALVTPVLGAALPAVPAGAAVVAYPPSPYNDWQARDKSGPITMLDQDMQIRRRGNALFSSAMVAFGNGRESYMGLQTDQERGTAGDKGIWSVWNAIDHTAPPANQWCAIDHHSVEGDVRSCAVPMAIVESHIYRMHVEVMLDNGAPRRGSADLFGQTVWGTWWHGEIRDVTDPAEVADLGTVLVSDHPEAAAQGRPVQPDTLAGDVGNFVESYIGPHTCQSRSTFAYDWWAPQWNGSISSEPYPYEATRPPELCWNAEKRYDDTAEVMHISRLETGYRMTNTWADLPSTVPVNTLDNDVLISERAPATAVRNDVTFANGVTARLGFDTGYTRGPQTVAPELVFSVPGAVEDDRLRDLITPNCARYSHDGTGITCRKAMDLADGHWYRFRLQHYPAGATHYWVARLIDLAVADDPGVVIGVAQLAGASTVTAVRNVTNLYGNLQSCDAGDRATVDYAAPRINASATDPGSTAALADTARTDCAPGNIAGVMVAGRAAVQQSLGGQRAEGAQEWTGTQDGTAANVDVQQDVTFTAPAAGTNGKLAWTFADAPHPRTGRPYGGEIGFRTDELHADGSRGDSAYWSWNIDGLTPQAATLEGADGVNARCDLAGTDTRVWLDHSCKKAMTIVAGHTYRMKLTRLPVEQLADGTTVQPWRGVISDNADPQHPVLDATIQLPANATALTALRNSAVYSGTVGACGAAPRATVDLTQPGFNETAGAFGSRPAPGPWSVVSTPTCAAPTVTATGNPAQPAIRIVTAA
jgi:hypothetical protein